MSANGTSPSKLIYLAGPIDLVDQETSRNWRIEAARILQKEGFGVFTPAHAFELPAGRIATDVAESVLEINDAALRACGAILANMSGPGYGTPIEFHVALAAGKIGACFNGNTESFYVKVWPHYKTMDEAITALVEKYGT